MDGTRAGGMKKRLGILGGGQLGKMLCLAAARWNLTTHVLDPSPDCPAAGVCSVFTRGDFRNEGDVMKFSRGLDVLTIEIEHVNTDALKKIQGVRVNPSPDIISCIQDKGCQKQFYRDNQIPSASPMGLGTVFESLEEIRRSVRAGELKPPFVQKLCRGGYDGRGVLIVRSESDLERLLDGPSVVEQFVEIEKEISVIVAQNAFVKRPVCFPPVEMVFNDEANLVEYVKCPVSGVDASVLRDAEYLAIKIAKLWKLRGIMAIEMFVLKDGTVLVNESAPRPHNSGHHTIESCATSQYEQCLRAVLGLPLGDTRLKTPSVMVNILGEPGHEGDAVYEGLDECMKVKGAHFHIYGKKRTKPFRKMGHVTVVDENIESAFEKARFIKQNLRVVS